MKLSEKSIDKLHGVHPDLVRVVGRTVELATAAGMDFSITDGVRTEARQLELFNAGASKTMKSRHIPSSNKSGLGEAIDFAVWAAGEVRWDWPLYVKVGALFKKAAEIEGVKIQWGGDWTSLKDGPHVELHRAAYPFAK